MSDEDLLKILEAHGQQFMQSFDNHVTMGKRKEGPITTSSRSYKKKKHDESQSEEEWAGITELGSSSSEGEEGSDEGTPDEGDADDDKEDREDGMCILCIEPTTRSLKNNPSEDDEFSYESGAHQPDVVVFSETGVASMIPKKSKSGFMVSLCLYEKCEV